MHKYILIENNSGNIDLQRVKYWSVSSSSLSLILSQSNHSQKFDVYPFGKFSIQYIHMAAHNLFLQEWILIFWLTLLSEQYVLAIFISLHL